MNKILVFILVFIVGLVAIGCARVQTLNLKPHQYSDRPNHIVVIQVAGLSESHIPLLKFNVADVAFKTSFENLTCMGQMWSYNLFELRPEASLSFLSQSNGSKNITGQCSDFDSDPFWVILSDIGYQVTFLENAATSEQSIKRSLACSQSRSLDLATVRLWEMRLNKNDNSEKKYFHYQDSAEDLKLSMKPGVYLDKSCQNDLCYSSITNNFKTLLSTKLNNWSRTLTVVRDFSFQKAIRAKNLSLAKEIMQDLDKMVEYARAQSSKDTLVIISGAESLPIEYPLQGNDWAVYEKTSKNVTYKNTSLLSPIMAFGPMSENFCGIFNENEFLKRIIIRPESKIFDWDQLNPF